MKAEERHELRENDLANWLHYGAWAFLRQNGSYILLILALAFLGYQLYQRHLQTVENERISAFVDLSNAMSADNERGAADLKDSFKALTLLPELIESSPVKEVKAQAALEMGRLYGAIAGSPPLLDQRQLTRAEALGKSFEFYNKALEVQGDDPLIAAKAHLGIAGVYEDQGNNWEKAREEYQKVIDGKMFAGPLADLARERLATLDDRRNAPRLAAWVPPKTVAPALPGLGNTGLPALPSGLINPGTSLQPVSPLTPSSTPSPGFMLGPPSNPGQPTTNPFNLGISPLGGGLGGLSPLTPATSPVVPEAPTTKPK